MIVSDKPAQFKYKGQKGAQQMFAAVGLLLLPTLAAGSVVEVVYSHPIPVIDRATAAK